MPFFPSVSGSPPSGFLGLPFFESWGVVEEREDDDPAAAPGDEPEREDDDPAAAPGDEPAARERERRERKTRKSCAVRMVCDVRCSESELIMVIGEDRCELEAMESKM